MVPLWMVVRYLYSQQANTSALTFKLWLLAIGDQRTSIKGQESTGDSATQNYPPEGDSESSDERCFPHKCLTDFRSDFFRWL